MATDREILKTADVGVAGSMGLAASATTAIASIHSRTRTIQKTGAETAAAAVAETVGLHVTRKSRLKNAWVTTAVAITLSTTNYAVVTLYKRTSAGATPSAIAVYNTALLAIGALTPTAFTVTTANADIDAGSIITYAITKAAAGQDFNVSNTNTVFDMDLEEC